MPARLGPFAARLLLALGFVLGVTAFGPSHASAKTFVAEITDDAGDADVGSRDVVAARVAYNRRTGALSTSITMAEPIDARGHDATLVLQVADLRHGLCGQARLGWIATLADPQRVEALVATGGYEGGASWAVRGHGGADGTTYSLRIRSRLLAGHTPGCAQISVLDTHEHGNAVLDETAANTGFR